MWQRLTYTKWEGCWKMKIRVLHKVIVAKQTWGRESLALPGSHFPNLPKQGPLRWNLNRGKYGTSWCHGKIYSLTNIRWVNNFPYEYTGSFLFEVDMILHWIFAMLNYINDYSRSLWWLLIVLWSFEQLKIIMIITIIL